MCLCLFHEYRHVALLCRDLAFLQKHLGAGKQGGVPEQLCEQVLEAEAARGLEAEGPHEAVLKPRQLEAIRRLPLQRRISRVGRPPAYTAVHAAVPCRPQHTRQPHAGA